MKKKLLMIIWGICAAGLVTTAAALAANNIPSSQDLSKTSTTEMQETTTLDTSAQETTLQTDIEIVDNGINAIRQAADEGVIKINEAASNAVDQINQAVTTAGDESNMVTDVLQETTTARILTATIQYNHIITFSLDEQGNVIAGKDLFLHVPYAVIDNVKKYIRIAYIANTQNKFQSAAELKSLGVTIKDQNGNCLDYSDGKYQEINVLYNNLDNISALYFCFLDQQITIAIS